MSLISTRQRQRKRAKPTLPIGERIRAAREEVGLTQKALAERLRLSAATVYLWESGMVDPGERLQQIADATGKELAWFSVGALDEAVPDVEAAEPLVEPALEEQEATPPAVDAAEQKEEPEAVEHAVADQAGPAEQERALAWTVEERERGLAARAAELEALTASLEEEREALAYERERMQEEATEQVERMVALAADEAQAAEEREQELVARAAELDAKAASLEEERAALLEERERVAKQEQEFAQREEDLVARAAELDAKDASLEAERAALQLDRERLAAQEHELAGRERELPARAAELDAKDASLEEERAALRELAERERELAARTAELDAQAARLDEHWAALAQERKQLQKLARERKNNVRAKDDLRRVSVDAFQRPAASQRSNSTPADGRRRGRLNLSAFPNIASAHEIGGSCIVVTLDDGRAIRVTARHDPEVDAFVSDYESAELGSPAWIPSRDYRVCTGQNLTDLLLAALKEVDSGPRSQTEAPSSTSSLPDGSPAAEESARPEVSSEESENGAPREASRRRGAWRRARRG